MLLSCFYKWHNPCSCFIDDLSEHQLQVSKASGKVALFFVFSYSCCSTNTIQQNSENYQPLLLASVFAVYCKYSLPRMLLPKQCVSCLNWFEDRGQALEIIHHGLILFLCSVSTQKWRINTTNIQISLYTRSV